MGKEKEKKELTPEQRKFLDIFIVGKTEKEQRQITQSYLAYRQRYDRVAALINTIEPGRSEYADLNQRLASKQVTALAWKGDFATAYEALADIELTAKNLAKGYVLGLSPEQLGKEVDEAGKTIAAIKDEFTAVRNGMATLIQDVREHPKASDYDNVAEAFAFRHVLTDTEAGWRGELQALQSRAERAAQLSDQMQSKDTIKALPHRVKTMLEQGNPEQKKAAQVYDKPVQQVVENAKLGDSIAQTFAEQVKAFESALLSLKDLGKFQKREAEGLPESIQALEEREAARIQKAKEVYHEALQNDRRLGLAGQPAQAGDANPQAPARTALGAFHPYMVLEDGLDGLTDAELDDARIAAAGKAAVDNLKKVMAQEGANSDVLFDLTVKSPDELKDALTQSMFDWLEDPFAPGGVRWTPQRKKLIQTLTDEIYKAVQADLPNRAADDMSTITMGKKIYKNPEKIGTGGFGEIFRYTADDGETVVVKALQADPDAAPNVLEKKRGEMIAEMRMHRLIDGGENGHNPNVVRQRGAAVGKDGTLLMLMDEAKGGDLNSLSQAVNELSRSGLIPEAARTAIVQQTMQQAVLGLKAVHDAGAMHLDIKGTNFFLDADGSVLLGDFGTGLMVDAEGMVDTRSVNGGTKEYEPPEYGRISQGSEVFWLGSLLQSMSSDVQADGTIAKTGRQPGGMTKMRTTNADGTAHVETSLDRLRNAMLDPDPTKRPSLDSVLLSSYLNDVDRAYTGKDVARLMRAVTNYNKKVGRQIVKITQQMNWLRGMIAKTQEELSGADAKKRATLEAQIRKNQDDLAKGQANLDAINAQPDVKALLDDIKRAGEAFAVISAPPPDEKFEAQDTFRVHDERVQPLAEAQWVDGRFDVRDQVVTKPEFVATRVTRQ